MDDKELREKIAREIHQGDETWKRVEWDKLLPQYKKDDYLNTADQILALLQPKIGEARCKK